MNDRNIIYILGLTCLLLVVSLVACAPPQSASLVQELPVPVKQTPQGIAEGSVPVFDDQDSGVVIPRMIQAIESSEPARLANLVGERGLVFAPYGVGVPEQGLTGARLLSTLEALVTDTRLMVLDYSSEYPWRIDMAVEGFNPVEISPAAGEAFRMTETGNVVWRLTEKGAWEMWIISTSNGGLPGMVEEGLEPPAPISDMDVRPIIGYLYSLLESGDVDALASIVAPQGLIIIPYGVGLPDRGLTGEELLNALRKLVVGAVPHIIAYDLSNDQEIGLVVTGLNAVQIQPAVGEELSVTNLTYMHMSRRAGSEWKLGVMGFDSFGLLEENINKPPFETTLPGADMPVIYPSPSDAALNLIETMRAFEIQVLMDMVPVDGLVISPYAAEVVYPGVKGEALRATLESLLNGALPELVAFDFSETDKIGLVISGLNPVAIKSSSGAALKGTGEVFVELEPGFIETNSPYYFLEGVWKFTQLAVDTDGSLSQAMTKPPFLPWK